MHDRPRCHDEAPRRGPSQQVDVVDEPPPGRHGRRRAGNAGRRDGDAAPSEDGRSHEAWVAEPESTLLLLGVAAGLVVAAVAPVASTIGGVAVTTALLALWHLLRDDLALLREPSTWGLAVAAWAIVHLLELRR